MAGTLDQALRGANKLEKSKRSSEALKLIENALSKWPNSPRLVERQQQLRLSIIKSDVDREPPIFVKKRLAELYKAAEWKHIIKIGSELVKLHPVSGFVLDLLAIAFRETGNLEKAEMLHRQSIASEPQNAAFYVNYSNTLRASQKAAESLTYLTKAVELNPGQTNRNLKRTIATAYNNLAGFFEDKAENSTVQSLYELALAVDPEYADAKFNLGAEKLRKLEFGEGWRLREYRLSQAMFMNQMEKFNTPAWNGQPTGKLFVWSEQGVGDEVMFASCFDELLNFATEVIVSVNKRSLQLFQRSFPRIRFVDKSVEPSEINYDDHIAAMSALGFLRPSIESFKNVTPGYIKADPSEIAEIRKTLFDGKSAQQIVGVSWYSNADRVGGRRTISLEHLIEALPENCILVNLQYGKVNKELRSLKKRIGRDVQILPSMDITENLDSLASVIAACDRVVSIDNSTAHFAGSLNKKCDILLPYSAEWRWGQRGTELSYWYPSVRLHWQAKPGDWSGCLQSISSTF